MTDPDLPLVSAARTGRQAESALLESYRPLARRLAASLARCAADRDDLEIVGLTALWRIALPTFDESRGVKFRTWAQRVMGSKMRNALRSLRHQRRGEAEAYEDDVPSDRRSALADCITSERVDWFDDVIAALTPTERAVLELRGDGMAFGDIGRECGISESRATRVYGVASRRLRGLAKQWGIGQPSKQGVLAWVA